MREFIDGGGHFTKLSTPGIAVSTRSFVLKISFARAPVDFKRSRRRVLTMCVHWPCRTLLICTNMWRLVGLLYCFIIPLTLFLPYSRHRSLYPRIPIPVEREIRNPIHAHLVRSVPVREP